MNTNSHKKIKIKLVDTSRDALQSIPDHIVVENTEYIDFIWDVITKSGISIIDCDSIVKKVKQMYHPYKRLSMLHQKLQKSGFLGIVERQIITLSAQYFMEYVNRENSDLLDMFESIGAAYAVKKAAPFNVGNLGKKIALENGVLLDPYDPQNMEKLGQNARHRMYDVLKIAQKYHKGFNLYISMFTGHPYKGLPQITPDDICEELLYHKEHLPQKCRITLSDTVGYAEQPEKVHAFLDKIAISIEKNNFPHPIGLHLHTRSLDVEKLKDIFIAAVEPFIGRKNELYFDIGMGAGGCPYAPKIFPNFPLVFLLDILEDIDLQIDVVMNRNKDEIRQLYEKAQKVFKKA